MTGKLMEILLVEDEPAHAAAIRRAFENTGVKVNITVAGTLAEFRKLAEETSPAIAVMDLNLPDGRAVEALVTPPEAGRFPILLMTSYGNEHIAVEAIKAGAIDYIVKSADSFIKMPRIVERAMREWGLLKEKQRLEEQLLHSQKLEAVGQLAGGVAHDLNNILMVIYGYCSTLQYKLGTGSPLRPEVDHIYAAAERAAHLTRSLLAFSRKQIMTPKPVDLNEIVMDIGKLLTRVIGEDIHFNMITGGKPLTVYADSGQIEQVLMNLATNARDAMPGGGLLTIETYTREIEEIIDYGDVGKYAVISVSDNGKGMDSETTKKIFEPFFTTKDVGKGTGLGLAIVYGVVRQHNGFINVYSEPEIGTTFKIFLPQLPDEELLNGGEVEDNVQGDKLIGNETVLVVEDDPAIRHLTETTLGELGYKVVLANDGMHAVERFKENRETVDIIIMDIVMPKKSGIEAYTEIKKICPEAKVLFMSGYSQDLLRNKGIINIGEELILKPVQPLELARKVRSMLDV